MNRQRALMTALMVAAALAAPAPRAEAQGFGGPGGSDNHAHARLFVRVADGEVRAVIRIEIEGGWHLYHDVIGDPKATVLPTTVEMGPGDIKWSRARFPKAHPLDQPDGTWANTHQGTIALYVLGELADGATGDDVTAKLDGQTCSDSGKCVLYGQSITAEGPGPDELFAAFPDGLVIGSQVPDRPAPAGERDDIDYAAVTFPDFRPQGEVATHAIGVWMLLAFVAGILLNVMPCVLPVISIKVLSFVQQAGESRSRVLALGSCFGAGMLAVFWALAIAAISLGMNWGEQFQSQAFMVVMISVIFAFALSLLGVFTLGVPKQIAQLDAGIEREGLGDAFFKGVLATLLATPCSGPFLGSTLAWTLAQTPMTIFLVFTMLGLGMGLPYVVLTAFPRLLAFLPKPGPWMETFKKVMGFILMVTVIYLMISLRTDLLLFANAFLVFVAIGCWAWGHYARFDQTIARRLRILAAALGIVALGAWLSFGVFRGAYTTDPDDDHIAWERFEPDIFEAHRKAGRTVFVDFSATWCPNCKFNEKFVFETDEVRKLLEAKGVVSMMADMTHKGPYTDMIKRLMKKLRVRSIPCLAVFPGDRPDEPFVRPDIVSVDTMKEILSACPDP